MAVKVSIKVPAALAKLYERLKESDKLKASTAAAQYVAPQLTRDLVEMAQVKMNGGSGPYARGWLTTPKTGGLVVTNSATYARWVEFKTRPHIIMPRPGGVLAWVPGRGAFSAFNASKAKAAASWVYARYVKHPGTAGKYVFEKTLKATGAARILSALDREARKFLLGEE